MTLLRSLGTLREREHSSQDTEGHKADKSEGEARSAERWLLVPRAEDHQRVLRDFSRVPGRDYIIIGGKLRQVSPAEFVAHLGHENKLRSRYRRLKKRGSRIAESWIKSKSTPLVEMTVTLAPWASDFFVEGAAVAPEKVADVLFQIGASLIPEIEKRTGCKVIGMTMHTDTDDPHANFQLARVAPDKDGIMRLVGNRGLGLVGPWAVAVDRQRRAGIVYEPHDAKFERALSRWRCRGLGRDLPLDIGLARLMDTLIEGLFGPMMAFKSAYCARVRAARHEAISGRVEALRHELLQFETLLPKPILNRKTLEMTR